MKSIIFRGHDVIETEDGWDVVKDGVILITVESEAKALNWIDAKRRVELTKPEGYKNGSDFKRDYNE